MQRPKVVVAPTYSNDSFWVIILNTIQRPKCNGEFCKLSFAYRQLYSKIIELNSLGKRNEIHKNSNNNNIVLEKKM